MADKTIPQLPLHNTLTPTDIIAAVQGGVAGHAPLSVLIALVLGNISVIENENGMSIRVPAARIQICAHITASATLNEGSASSGFRTPTQSWTYPRPFSEDPYVVGTPYIAGGHIFGVRLGDIAPASVSYRVYGLEAGAQGRLMVLAIGKY
jgi:hypothetical protein